MLDGVIPVVVAEQHWPGDQLDIFGLNAITDTQTDFGPGATHLTIIFVAGELEVLLWKVEAASRVATGLEDFPVQMFTPLQNYGLVGGASNPLIPNPVNPAIYFPWLQPVNQGDAGRLSRSVALAGAISGQQLVSVNGVPTTSIGPIMQTLSVGNVGLLFGNYWPQYHGSSYTPPLRLKPFTRLALQMTVSGGSGGNHISANFYYSERAFEPGQ